MTVRRRGTLAGHTYEFRSLADLLAKATPHRSGDVLAGCAAESAAQRVAAQGVLADLPLATFLDEQVVGYEEDSVTRLILDTHDREAFVPVSALTVGEFRDRLLAWAAAGDEPAIGALAPGLTPEMVAATAKLMRTADLVAVARRARVVTGLRGTLGLPGRLASRLQPNHPTDDRLGVTASVVDGLLHGCGDAVIGINPATDSPARTVALLHLLDEVIERYEIPTQSCVLAHVTTTLRALEQGAPVDLVFQSVAGTQAANRGFGVTLDLLAEAQAGALALGRGTVGRNVMYFETGQGSALSADAHRGVDGPGGPADPGGARLRRRPALRAAAGQHRRRLHRPGVPLRRQAGGPRRPGGPLLRQAARRPDGRGRLLHQPRRGRRRRHRRPHAAAGRGRVHLPHRRAGRRRRDAALPVAVVHRRADHPAGARTAAGAGVRGVAGPDGPAGRRRPG